MTRSPIPKPDELVETARKLDAELRVLDLYDYARGALGHDYGNGQRFRELVRVRRQAESAARVAAIYSDEPLSASRAQLLEAMRRISSAKLRRFSGNRSRDAFDRAAQAWRAVAVELEADPR